MSDYSFKKHLLGIHSGSGVGGIPTSQALTGRAHLGRVAGQDVILQNEGVVSHDQAHSALHGKKAFVEGLGDKALVTVDPLGYGASALQSLFKSKHVVSTGDRSMLEVESAAKIAEDRFGPNPLDAQRTMRLSEHPDLMTGMVRPASEAPIRGKGSLLTGEWEVPQLAGLGLGMLALNSLLMRA